ncbi:TIGR02281 family clan AA aspartic protease [Nodosilinea sp. E11]|uniref:retropepsin-like aspartic protease family protein n=1 Tax=Nodosilinea sp. E11 TaxID=3037479 RepID=UPI002935026B|nr:aspartyl protease family protein [Nodosilinea sp. E11]WOD38334.1 aspartyl protease family protein [Nodosilinea sp. E11]
MLGSLAWSLGGCSLAQGQRPTTTADSLSGEAGESALSVQAAPPAKVATSPPSAPATDTFREAVNRATNAVAIGQSAQSTADWQLAASRWQQAIALMEQVPSSSPNYAQARTKVQEYKQHLAAAQRSATDNILAAPAPDLASPALPAGLAAQIPIQRRQGGTPVVAVTLRGTGGTQTFPMLFDTGATGTLITPEMAQAVGVAIVGETQARIADGSVVKLPIGYVDALELGGLRREKIRVAIGGSYGLLGQDIYGQYGIAIGSHMIHLHK